MTKERIVMVVGAMFVVLAPVIFTLPTWERQLDFTQTGQIGDTIGGVTSPIINLIGILLIYWSFEKQIDANKIQLEKNNFDILYSQFTEFKTDIIEIWLEENYNILENDHVAERAHISFEGYEVYERLAIGIRDYKGHYIKTSAPAFEHFTYILFSMKLFLSEIDKSTLQHNHKEYLFRKFFYIYVPNLAHSFEFIRQEAIKVKEYTPLKNDLDSVLKLIDKLRLKYSDI